MSDDGPNAIIQRLFLHAERRLGGAVALGTHLGLKAEDLAPYLAGSAIPPADVLLRTVSLVLDDLDAVMRGHPARAWQKLMAGYRSGTG